MMLTGATVYRPARWALPARTDPAQEPVGLEEMKAHGVLEAPDDDALTSGHIVAARRWMESFLHRALITQTATYLLDKFPDRRDVTIELPGGTLQSVTSIQYVDTAGATQTWDASNYSVDTGWEPGRVSLAYDKDWPAVREWNLPITITYQVGYGDNPGDVPEEIRHAIKMIAAELSENREESTGMQIAAVPWRAERLASAYRIIRII